MSSFYISDYTDTTITISIDASNAGWYFVLIYDGNNLVDTPIYYISDSGVKTYSINNLSSGTKYSIEVKYNVDYDIDSAISIGGRDVTTSGNGGGSGSEPEPDEPEPDEPDPDEPNVDEEGFVYINRKRYIPYIYNGSKWVPAQAYIYNYGWKPTVTQ